MTGYLVALPGDLFRRRADGLAVVVVSIAPADPSLLVLLRLRLDGRPDGRARPWKSRLAASEWTPIAARGEAGKKKAFSEPKRTPAEGEPPTMDDLAVVVAAGRLLRERWARHGST